MEAKDVIQPGASGMEGLQGVDLLAKRARVQPIVVMDNVHTLTAGTIQKIATALGVSLEMRLVEAHGRETGPERTEDDLVRLISPSFWDKRLEASDLDEYPDWVLGRVLMFGTAGQVSAARRFFGDDAIRGAIKNRGIDARTRNYWELILG